MLADAVAALGGIVITFVAQRVLAPVDNAVVASQWLLIATALPVWVAGAVTQGLYTARANARLSQELRHVVVATFAGVAAVVGTAFILNVDDLSRAWTASLFISVAACVAGERLFARRVFRRLRTSGRLSRPILIVGGDTGAGELADRLRRRTALGYHPVGFVCEGQVGRLAGLEHQGHIDDIDEALERTGANGVVISLHSVAADQVNRLARHLVDRGVHVALASSLRDIDISRLRIQELDGQALLYVEPTIRTGWRRRAKRLFDIAIAAGLLVITAPLILLAAIAIRLESPGPVFFRQRRVGLDGATFQMIKLRTMCDGADGMRDGLLDLNEADGPLFKVRCDPRITRVGRVLRKFSVDELPQFWNVLCGDMSVVGPRPALPCEVESWDDELRERLRVLPGISGLWQVSGRATTTFDEYKRLDLYYVDNWSLGHDLRIVARTVGVVLRGKDAS